jgi:hypothetical protein
MSAETEDEMADALRLWRYLSIEAQKAFRSSAAGDDDDGCYRLAHMVSVSILAHDSNRQSKIAIDSVPSGPDAGDQKREIHRAFNATYMRLCTEMVLPFRKPDWERKFEAERAAMEERLRVRAEKWPVERGGQGT